MRQTPWIVYLSFLYLSAPPDIFRDPIQCQSTRLPDFWIVYFMVQSQKLMMLGVFILFLLSITFSGHAAADPNSSLTRATGRAREINRCQFRASHSAWVSINKLLRMRFETNFADATAIASDIL